MNCPGSVAAVRKAKIFDEPSEYAAEGSAAHQVAQWSLDQGVVASTFIGKEIEVDGFEFTVDEEMASYVQVYVDAVNNQPGDKMVEELLDLSSVYGVENQFGTSDAVSLNLNENNIIVNDLKYGRGVMVFAKDNPQLYSYAAGVLVLLDDVWDWETVTIMVHQPRLDHIDAVTITVEELRAFIRTATEAGQLAMSLLDKSDEEIAAHLVPGEEQCRWCPFKGKCAALTTHVHEAVFDGFEDLTVEATPKDVTQMSPEQLAKTLNLLDLINSWVSDVRAEGLQRVKGGLEVPGWKLVAGKKGARAWTESDAAEDVMRKARVKADVMFSKKLITPTQAEKALKSKPKIWKKLQELITQADGKPGLAPESDTRPALAVAAQFENVEEDDFGDLI